MRNFMSWLAFAVGCLMLLGILTGRYKGIDLILGLPIALSLISLSPWRHREHRG
jgi:hypothetical protein